MMKKSKYLYFNKILFINIEFDTILLMKMIEYYIVNISYQNSTNDHYSMNLLIHSCISQTHSYTYQ